MLKDDTEKLQDVFRSVSNLLSTCCRAMAGGSLQLFQCRACWPGTHHQCSLIVLQVAADILPSLHVVVRSPATTQLSSQSADPIKGNSPQSSDGPTSAQIQHNSQQQATPLHIPGHAVGSRPANPASSNSPFAYSNGNHTPAVPPSPMTPLIPLGSMARAPSGDIQAQQQVVRAGSSGSVPGAVSAQGMTQGSPSAVSMPARQLSLPRPQSRAQHGPVNAGPTLHPARGSQVSGTALSPVWYFAAYAE